MQKMIRSPMVWLGLLVAVVLLLVGCAGPQATQPPAPTAAPQMVEPTQAPEPTQPPPPATAPEPTQAAAAKDVLDEVLAAGVLKVSTDPNYAPQSFLNDKGELDGFDIDVAKETAKRLGVKVEFVTPDWNIITAGNWGGRWDLSIGSMTITPDRAQVLYFTEPYYYTPAQFAIRADLNYTSLDDLVGKTVCAGAATTYEEYMNGTLKLAGEQILRQVTGIKPATQSTDQECVQSIQAGRKEYDGVLTSLTVVEQAIQSGVPIKKLGDPVYYEDLAFAADRSRGPSEQFIARLDEILTAMHADGTLTQLSMKWFNGVDLTTKVQ
jgi:polar amino acid transport system substrate-binding protein